MLEKSKTFKPKKYKSNTANMINLLNNYIKEDDHTSWFNKLRSVISYLFFGVLSMVLNIVSFYLFTKMGINLYISNFIAWFLAVIFAYVTNKIFVFNSLSLSKKTLLKESLLFLLFRVLSLGIDMGLMYTFISVLFIDKIISKVLVNVVVVFVNYIFSKFIIFKK